MKNGSVWCRAALAAMVMASPAGATEKILSYHSEIEVRQDASLSVTETITVRAEGDQIKRGIYRDFPTTYQDNSGNRYVVDFNLHQVLRDGKPEPYHTESLSNGMRIYIGHADVFLSSGRYVYTIGYSTRRQIGFFDQHDELYWNVTGTDWAFPIETASARVTLPGGVNGADIGLNGFTGRYGATERQFRAGIGYDNEALFETERELASGEGLTIVVTWPKGFVDEPTRVKKFGYLLRDNAHLLVFLAGFLVVLLYYLYTWKRVGVDPEKGTVVPRFDPPRNLSPAAMRFISELGYDRKAFTAAIINMAVKGAVSIEEDDDEYTLIKQSSADLELLSSGELKVHSKLFSGGKKLVLKNKNHKKVSAAVKALKDFLKREYEDNHFKTNMRYLVPGIVITLITLALGVFLAPQAVTESGFLLVWLCMWTFAVVFLVKSRRWFMAILFALFEIPVLATLYQLSSLSFVIMLLAFVGINVMFYYLLQAPTRLGRGVMDEIEGFRQYLEVAEEDKLNLLNPPEKTPELFERFLPYALALGVDQQWSEKFSGILAAAASDPDSGYRPRWYHGSHIGDFGSSSFSKGLGAGLAAAVASSAVAPGSSSGSGGGGFSGGGGGGGGGGGW